MTDYTIKTQKDLDKFKDNYGYKIEGNASFEASFEFEGRLYVGGYLSIKAGDWIKAGGSIKAGDWIEAGDSIEAGDWIKAGGWIEAGDWIEAGGSIEAGDWIKAGGWIEAGGSIEAVLGGISAGLSIICKGKLSFKLRLFAGTAPYSWVDGKSANKVTCGKLKGGEVCYGEVEETGLEEEPVKDKEVEKAIKLLEEKGILKDGKVIAG